MVVRETERLGEAFPELALNTTNGEYAIVSGVIRVIEDLGYYVDLAVPNDYPKSVPKLRCHPSEIPWLLDRHVIPKTGIACLCVASEYRVHWPRGSDLTDFLQRLVVPYLAAQLYYDAHGSWPESGQRSHGGDGIVEAYRDLLEQMGTVSERTIRNVMGMLAGRQHPREHDRCPCGSGRKLRKCHGPIVWELRGKVDRRHAASDYELLFGRWSRGGSG